MDKNAGHGGTCFSGAAGRAGLNESVTRSLVGQVGNLRRVVNPPFPKRATRSKKRRLPTGAQDTILPYNAPKSPATSAGSQRLATN
jgi:hypothetical protein